MQDQTRETIGKVGVAVFVAGLFVFLGGRKNSFFITGEVHPVGLWLIAAGVVLMLVWFLAGLAWGKERK